MYKLVFNYFYSLVFRRRKVKVIYKSGAVQKFRCKEFQYTRKNGETTVTWMNMWPRPLAFGVDDVAAIIQIK